MEYLLVKFQESRGVIIDGISEGMTNQVLELETGFHSVTLEAPRDFTKHHQAIAPSDAVDKTGWKTG